MTCNLGKPYISFQVKVHISRLSQLLSLRHSPKMDPTPTTLRVAALASTSMALGTAGIILSISTFTTPILSDINRDPETKPKLALKNMRDLFSTGSHFIPQLSVVSAAGYAYLAYFLPAKRQEYSIAAGAVASILPFTTLVMWPIANRRLKELGDKAREGRNASEAETEELFSSFGWLNTVRAGLMGAGGVIGLWTALA